MTAFIKGTEPKCSNCQSDNENIALTTNNTCPVCGRLLTDKDFDYKLGKKK